VVGVLLISLMLRLIFAPARESIDTRHNTRSDGPNAEVVCRCFYMVERYVRHDPNFRTLKDENALLREHNTIVLQAYSRLEALEGKTTAYGT
jgi:hypothetical protein